MMIVAGFISGACNGIISIFVAPIVFVVMVLASRICLELVIVIFRMADHSGAVTQSGEGEVKSESEPPKEPKSRKTTGKKTRKKTKKTTKGEEEKK